MDSEQVYDEDLRALARDSLARQRVPCVGHFRPDSKVGCGGGG